MPPLPPVRAATARSPYWAAKRRASPRWFRALPRGRAQPPRTAAPRWICLRVRSRCAKGRRRGHVPPCSSRRTEVSALRANRCWMPKRGLPRAFPAKASPSLSSSTVRRRSLPIAGRCVWRFPKNTPRPLSAATAPKRAAPTPRSKGCSLPFPPRHWRSISPHGCAFCPRTVPRSRPFLPRCARLRPRCARLPTAPSCRMRSPKTTCTANRMRPIPQAAPPISALSPKTGCFIACSAANAAKRSATTCV